MQLWLALLLPADKDARHERQSLSHDKMNLLSIRPLLPNPASREPALC